MSRSVLPLLLVTLLVWPLWPVTAAEEPNAAPPAFRQILLDTPDPAILRASHESLCSEPHTAGTPGEWRTIEKLETALKGFGLEIDRHDFYPYLAHQGEAVVEVLAGGKRIRLPLQEKGLEEDPSSRDPRARPGWNAYSGTGDLSAAVVYANYARREDFEELKKRGVSVAGKIVIARYGRIFRGHKALFAEQAGAGGLLIYTDPDDAGYRRGIPYPEGGWANAYYIQRGSLLALDYPGDPLTPGAPATKDAPRLAPGSVALPTIPVQPLGWGAAQEILSRMRGSGVPRPWQGGLPFAYRLEGGDGLKVHLSVHQERRITHSANVLGILRGRLHPEQLVIVGCHFDAWTFGSGDPNAGTIVLLEMARSFAEAARTGHRPARTIVFANWSGEEFGMLGSTEYCEAHRDNLEKHAVAYLNMDMAAMGSRFQASALPLLKSVMKTAASEVPQAGRHAKLSAWEAWEERAGHAPELGNPGGGSDHLPFMSYLGIPVAAFGAGGSPGVSYHSNYETIAWYQQVVGKDYEGARMLARIGNMLLLHLADDPLLPLDPAHYAPTLRGHLDVLAKRVDTDAFREALAPLYARIDALEKEATRFKESIPAILADPLTLANANQALLTLERAWLSESGLPSRPWFHSLYNATDPDTGYGAWPLPLIEEALQSAKTIETTAAVAASADAIDKLIETLRRAVPATDPQGGALSLE